MGGVRLPDTILRSLIAQGRLPEGAAPAAVRGSGRGGRRAEDVPGTLAAQCRAAGLPLPVREYHFWPGRRHRFDLAWPEFRVALEVDGGVFMVRPDGLPGGHARPARFRADCVKLSEAAARGWRVLRVMPEHVESGEALGWVERALLGGPPWE